MARKSTVISTRGDLPHRRARALALERFLDAKIDDLARPEYARLQRDCRRILELTVPLQAPGSDRRPLASLDQRALDRSAPGARRAALTEADRRIRAGKALNRLAELLSEADVRLDFERVPPDELLAERVIPLVPLRPTFRVTGRWSEIVFALYEKVLGAGQLFLARCGHLVAREIQVGRRPVTCGAADCVRAARREPAEATAKRQRRKSAATRRPRGARRRG